MTQPSLFPPHPLLKEYVEAIVIVKLDFSSPESLSPIYTYMPTNTRFLCFYLEDPVKVKKEDGLYIGRPGSMIIGQQLKPVVLDLGQKHLCVYVALKPSSMFRLLGIPQNEMIDLDFDSRSILGKEVDELLQQLQEAVSHQELNVIIQQYLLERLKKLKPALPFDQAILELVKAGGNMSVEQAASLSCLSFKQFERKCIERIGLNPKLYSRVVRFSNAYKYKEQFPNVSWTKIAHHCGYYDQAHLIRDFKSFAGFNPGQIKEEDIENSVRFQLLGE